MNLSHIGRFARKALHVATFPIHAAVERFHHPHVAKVFKSKKAAKVSVGVTIMLVGSTMATHPVAWMPHVLWDALAYGLHGYGALPVIKILTHHLDLENIEEEVKEEVERDLKAGLAQEPEKFEREIIS